MTKLDPKKYYRFRMNETMSWSVPAKMVTEDGKEYFHRGDKDPIERQEGMEIKEVTKEVYDAAWDDSDEPWQDPDGRDVTESGS